MKMINSVIKVALGAVVLLGAMACSSNYYDEEKYQEYLDYNLPVDSIDSRHQWLLSTEQQYRVKANAGTNLQTIMILANNPLTDKTALVLGKTSITDGAIVDLPVCLALTQKTLYAALVDKDGKYYVTSFPANQTEVSFDTFSSGIPTDLTLKHQGYTYIFEKDFPLAGDFDYNDLVLRISTERTGSKQVTIHVTVAAVGCNVQLAGYIWLMNCKYDDIESVTTADGRTFNDNLPSASQNLVDNYDLFIRGRNDRPVICLFADAHWAMDSHQEIADNNGSIAIRKYYNTAKQNNEEYEIRTPVSESYIVNFKDSKYADNLTLEELDPFIVTDYNSARYETHKDDLKAAQVLYQYQVDYRIKTLPWMLIVPTSDFYHPLEGVQIGFRKKTQTGAYAMFGAYTTNNHSFGQWVEDCQSNLDWYGYPNKEYVW